MLFGTAYKGIPLVCATAICLQQLGINKSFAFNRKEEKEHGEGGHLIGAPLEGRVLIVDDVVSAGTATRHSVELIKTHDAKAAALIVSFDRQEKGNSDKSSLAELREQFELKVVSVAALEDLVAVIQGNDRYAEFLNMLIPTSVVPICSLYQSVDFDNANHCDSQIRPHALRSLRPTLAY